MVRVFIPMILLMIAGCSGLKDYDVTLNERLVYSPRPLRVDDGIVDAALRDCIGQTLKDRRPTTPQDLDVLICTEAGIVDLTGIGVYQGLRQIKLSNNALQDAGPLADLQQLRSADLSGNTALDCTSLPRESSVNWLLPDHCTS